MSTPESVRRPDYLGEPALSWVERLRSPDPLTRRLAAYALGMIGPAARDESVPALAEAVAGRPGDVRPRLGRVGPGEGRAG